MEGRRSSQHRGTEHRAARVHWQPFQKIGGFDVAQGCLAHPALPCKGAILNPKEEGSGWHEVDVGDLYHMGT